MYPNRNIISVKALRYKNIFLCVILVVINRAVIR